MNVNPSTQSVSSGGIPETVPEKINYGGHSISDADTRAKLEALANLLGRTIRVTSGDRTPEDQARLLRQGKQPAKDSMHLHGKAADIVVDGMTPAEVAPYARQAGFTGIGIYQDGHLHVDTREGSATWYR